MSVQLVQLALCAFSLFMVYVLYLHWKKREISVLMFLAWLVVWSVFIVLVMYPKLLESYINNVFRVKETDLILVMAFMVLTYVTVENNIKIRNYENKLEKLVREMALKK